MMQEKKLITDLVRAQAKEGSIKRFLEIKQVKVKFSDQFDHDKELNYALNLEKKIYGLAEVHEPVTVRRLSL